MRLHGQIVWITGSARRVGRAMALACAAEGAAIAVHCRASLSEAEATAREIQDMGSRAIVVQGDHSIEADVARMTAEIEAGLGGLTALVNNAATFPKRRFEDITPAEFDAVVAANLRGPFLCARACLPMLRQASPGRIVNITDWAVERPYRHYAHYMAAKGGLHTMTRALARELAPGILVNGIAPGPVLEPEDLDPITREIILKRTPTGRWGTPDSVAKALIFLLESVDVCGEIVTVDGGRSVG